MLDCDSTIVAGFPFEPDESVAPLTRTGDPFSALSTCCPPAPSRSSRVHRAPPVPFIAGSTCLLAVAASRLLPPLKPAGARSVTSVPGFLSAAARVGSAAESASAKGPRPRDLSFSARGWQQGHLPQVIWCSFFMFYERVRKKK